MLAHRMMDTYMVFYYISMQSTTILSWYKGFIFFPPQQNTG